MNKFYLPLIGTILLLTFSLIHLLMLRPGEPKLSDAEWVWFGGAALALVLAAVLPSVARRLRGLPPHPVSPSYIKFSVTVAVVLSPLAFFAVREFGPFGSFVIMLVPIAFILRSPHRSLLKRKY